MTTKLGQKPQSRSLSGGGPDPSRRSDEPTSLLLPIMPLLGSKAAQHADHARAGQAKPGAEHCRGRRRPAVSVATFRGFRPATTGKKVATRFDPISFLSAYHASEGADFVPSAQRLRKFRTPFRQHSCDLWPPLSPSALMPAGSRRSRSAGNPCGWHSRQIRRDARARWQYRAEGVAVGRGLDTGQKSLWGPTSDELSVRHSIFLNANDDGTPPR